MKTCEKIMAASKAGDFIRLISRAGVMYLAEVGTVQRNYYGAKYPFPETHYIAFKFNIYVPLIY
jgi:hypothetical protein